LHRYIYICKLCSSFRLSPFFIESEHGRFPGTSKSKWFKFWPYEQEYPLRHERFNLLGPVGPTCKTPLEKYGEGDEEKRACGLKRVIESYSKDDSDLGRNLSCIVFSVGSNNQWSFEEAIYRETQCVVHTFDCTVNAEVPSSISSRVKFYKVCLGDRDTTVYSQQFMTWDSLISLSGTNISPTFLKMDIEGFEFGVLRSIIDSGKHLPLQIALEVHLASMGDGFSRARSSAQISSFSNYLHTFGGYFLIDRNDNPYCQGCSEILLARLVCHDVNPANFTDLFKASHKHPMFSEAISHMKNGIRGFDFRLLEKFQITSIMKGSGLNTFVRIGNMRHMIQRETLDILDLQRAPVIRLPDDEILGIPLGDNFESIPFVKEILLRLTSSSHSLTSATTTKA